jgi:hypothetical protein
MVKINRRRLLLSGFTAAGMTGSAAIAQSVQAQTQRNPNPVAAPANSDTVDAIFGAAAELPAPSSPTQSATSQPTIPYDREISKLLIRCSHLGIEQFERGQRDPRYNGSIRLLDSYSSRFDRYAQMATFTATLDATTTLLPNLGNLGNRLIGRIVTPRQVFFGFVLTSDTHNIIVFRGTSNPKEWIANFQANQSNYVQGGVNRGRVHTGFLRLYTQLSPQVQRAAKQFKPALPCFVTGHSLGGALATLATTDLTHNNRALQNIQLYSYAAPRIGDGAFANYINTIAPNTFRIINLSDIVPMVPPTTLRAQEFTHAGQEWVFLDYAGGDVSATHTTTRYQMAIDQQVETNQILSFPTACR